MFSYIWFTIIVVLVVDVRTGALQQKDVVPLRCNSCIATNNSLSCNQPTAWMAVACPADRPYCATTAVAPNFTSSLSCATATDVPCTLTHSREQRHEMTCICIRDLCNAPFSGELQNELLNFSFNTENNSRNISDFFKRAAFSNISNANLYEAITEIKLIRNNSLVTTLTSVPRKDTEKDIPHAEALKHEATVPSDDDEDESEGSGSYEESRSVRPPSAPAAPSSFLPANENKAPNLLITLDLTIMILLLLVLV